MCALTCVAELQTLSAELCRWVEDVLDFSAVDVEFSGNGAPTLTWLSLDPLVPLGSSGRDSVQGLPLPPGLILDYQHGVFAVLGARIFDGAGDRGYLLARAHPSGGWTQWLSGEPAPGGEGGP